MTAGESMVSGSNADGIGAVDFVELLRNWREYAAICRPGDYDVLVGDEPNVPILYDPL
jgi:hypothetical protein